MANEQKHRFRDAMDWARCGHWLWTVLSAGWKSFIGVAAVTLIAAVLSNIKHAPLPLLFVYLLCVAVIYAIGWVVRKFAMPPFGITAKFIQTRFLPSSWAQR
jgi:hypothetical protein